MSRRGEVAVRCKIRDGKNAVERRASEGKEWDGGHGGHKAGKAGGEEGGGAGGAGGGQKSVSFCPCPWDGDLQHGRLEETPER